MKPPVLASSTEHSNDIRPLVAEPVNNRGAWMFGIVLLVGAISLFTALELRRSSTNDPAPQVMSDRPGIASPPELALPEFYVEDRAGLGDYYPYPVLRQGAVGAPAPAFAPLPSRGSRRVTPATREASNNLSPPLRPYAPLPPPEFSETPRIPSVVYQAPSPPGQAPLNPASSSLNDATRAQAERLANPEVTVPQGTIIQAVMETALDSTRPGYVRAIVSRDVRGFDGSRVLIPRGSRLYGEYKSEVTQGQSRAMIAWQRLLRPDGVIMDIDSPATDPLGRAGVKGRVNSHFFARFGGTILQSVLDLGVGLATRPLRDGVVLNFPQAGQTIAAPAIAQNISPTLTIPQGTSVSVYAARDLDFSAVES